jgi:hypothetical protein
MKCKYCGEEIINDIKITADKRFWNHKRSKLNICTKPIHAEPEEEGKT